MVVGKRENGVGVPGGDWLGRAVMLGVRGWGVAACGEGGGRTASSDGRRAIADGIAKVAGSLPVVL